MIAETDAIGPMPWRHLHLWRPLVVGFLKLIMFLCGPLRVRGKYRVPRQGGLLILANHLSDADPVAVQCACPRPIRFMAKSELFNIRLLGAALRWGYAFPVRRGEPDRNALKLATNMLRAGECVCVFPEGQIAEDGHFQPLKPGIALIARMAGVPVICCGLRGTNKMIPYGSITPRPALHWIDAEWGEVKQFDKTATAEEILSWVEGQLRSLGTD